MARMKAMVTRARSRLARTDTFALVATLLLIAKLLLTRYYVLGRAAGFGALADACAIAAVVVACALGGRKVRRTLIMVVSVVLPLVMLAGVMYASYFNELPSAGMLSVSPQLASAGAGTERLLRWGYLLYVADWPLLLFGPAVRPLLPSGPRRLLAAVGGLSLLVASLAAIAATAFARPLNVVDCSYRFGFFAYQAASLQAPAPSAAAASESKALQARIDELTGHTDDGKRRADAPAPGSMKGKNLIVVQMESMQASLIGARIDGKPIVPNLEKLVAESTYFPNAYSQIGRGNTSDAEFVTNTSLYPCLEQPSAVAYAGKSLPSLPRLLAAAGYETMTMHTNEATFWNRDHLYPALGFETVYDQGYFGKDEWAGFGASDKVLFDRGMLLLNAAAAEGSPPFYAQLVTVSAHYPFTRTGGTSALATLSPDVADTETGRYLQAQSYADAQLGRFIKKLRKSGLLEKSVLVVYGDHFGLRLDATDADRRLRDQLFGHAYNPADFYNVPLVIRVPGAKAVRNEAVVGQVDILPTIADLYGLDISAQPHFGVSAFVESPTLLTRASSVETYIDAEVAFFRGASRGDGSYSPSTHVPLAGATAPERLANGRRLVELSESYVTGLSRRDEGADATATVGFIPPSTKEIEKTPYR